MVMLALVLIIPIVLIGTVSITNFTNTASTNAKAQMQNLITLNADIVKKEMESAKVLAASLANNRQLALFVRGDETFRNMIFTTLQKSVETNPDVLESVIIAGKNGMTMMSSDKLIDTGLNLSERSYFNKAMEGQITYSDVIISKTSNQPILVVAAPIRDGKTITGVVVTTVKFSVLSDLCSEIKAFDNGYAFIFDKQGKILSHPNSEYEFVEHIKNVESENLYNRAKVVMPGHSDLFENKKDGMKGLLGVTPIDGGYLAIRADESDYLSSMYSTRILILIIMLASLVVCLAAGYIFVTRRVNKPIRALSDLMQKAGGGDLTVRSSIHTKDEIQLIGDSFNEMISAQNEMVSKVKTGAGEVFQSSDDISRSVTDVSDSSQNIAKSIQEVAGNSEAQNKSILETNQTILQLSSLIQLAKKRASEANENVLGTKQAAVLGRNKVEETIGAIQNINETTNSTAQRLSEIENLSDQVKGIIVTINAIAEQTNLLALNASIEAARAGEHGRGFSVVAEEVRKLAVQTGDEADGIANVVREMVAKIDDAVANMDQGRVAVENGVHVAKETDDSFASIMDSVQNITDAIDKITEVTDDEIASSEVILQLIEKVSRITEANSAHSQEVAASVEEQTALMETIAAGSEELAAMATEQKDLVESFKI